MISLNCAECNRLLKIKDELAGKRARCPGCQTVFVIPDAPVLDAEMIQEDRPRRARRKGEEEDEGRSQSIRRAAAGDRRRAAAEDDEPEEEERPRQRSRRDEDDDRARRRSRDEADDESEEEDRPRRKKGVCCPNCGSRKSTKVHWTPFGGFVAPLIINMVRCNRCGTGYNGKHGDYNTGRLTIFYIVCAGVGLVLGIIGAIAEMK